MTIWPSMAGWAASLLIAIGVGWGFTALGIAIALRRFRRANDRPWYERARLAFPARALVRSNRLVLLVILVESLALLKVDSAGPWSNIANGVAWNCLAGLVGVSIAGVRLEKRLCRTADEENGSGLPISVLIFWPAALPLLIMVALIPPRWGWAAAAVLAGGAVALLFHLEGGWIHGLRWLGWVGPASPRLSSIVGRAASRCGTEPTATYELKSFHANAVAFPISKILVFTTPALEGLDDHELESVTAHELGHLAEPWAVYLTRILGSVLMVFAVAGIPLGGSFGWWAGLAPPAVMLVGTVFLRRVGRRMEERSDRMGHDHEGLPDGAYSRALEKIYRVNQIPVVSRGRQVHPHLYDRLAASGTAPDYPRPAAPPRDALAGFTTVLLIACVIVPSLRGGKSRARTNSENAYAMAAVARRSYVAGDLEAAANLYRQAARTDPSTPHYDANLALTLSRLGRYDEAEAAVVVAEKKLADGPGLANELRPTLDQVRETIRRSRLPPGRGGQASGPAVTNPAPDE